jgi:hypothetical protein
MDHRDDKRRGDQVMCKETVRTGGQGKDETYDSTRQMDLPNLNLPNQQGVEHRLL